MELNMFDEAERSEIFNAAYTLCQLSGKNKRVHEHVRQEQPIYPIMLPNDQIMPKKKRNKVHPVHDQKFVDNVKTILQSRQEFANIAVTDRKGALRAVLSVICPLVELKECGYTNKRVFVVKEGKRFRTYGDAIKTGALDALILQTGTALLLCGCHKQAEERYDYLMLQI